jgi:hypothetical protein
LLISIATLPPHAAALERFKKFCGRRNSGHTFPLTLTLSLGEREQLAKLSGFSTGCLANPDAGFRDRRPMILPLPRERAGVRGRRPF